MIIIASPSDDWAPLITYIEISLSKAPQALKPAPGRPQLRVPYTMYSHGIRRKGRVNAFRWVSHAIDFNLDLLHCDSGRKSEKPVAQLDKERIAVAALAVADKRGPRGFTLRAVAKALSVTPMALYHHVRNKAELAALVVSLTTRKHPFVTPTRDGREKPTGDWREDMLAAARWMREMSFTHPAVQAIRHAYQIYTPEMLLIAERWTTLWRQSGLSIEGAVLAARTSGMLITGMIAEEALLRGIDVPDSAAVAHLPNAQLFFENEYDPDEVFELAVRSLLDGLHARLIGIRKRPAHRLMRPRAKRKSRPTS